MKLAKDDLIAALRLRYDHYSAPTMFDRARERAGLTDQPAYDAAEVARFRAALARVGDRLANVDARLESLLAATSVEPATPASVGPATQEPTVEPARPEPARPPANVEPRRTRGRTAPPVRDDDDVTASPGGRARKPTTIETTIALSGVDAGADEQVMMCGGLADLGDWDPARARPMLRDGERWLATIQLAAGAEVAYKFLRRAADGRVTWEHGDNRNLVAQPRVDATWRR
jgi:Starch binding domain